MSATPGPQPPVLPPTAPDEAALRRGLYWVVGSTGLNTIFALWTFAGPVFLLYLDALGLSKGQIGGLLSLFPFCGLLALVAAPAVTRIGRKRVFLAGYGLRKFVMASLLLLPVVQARWGDDVAHGFLVSAIALFAVLRALAETGFYPWSQEFVPDRVRGQYNASLNIVCGVTAAFAYLTASHVLAGGAGLDRFLLLMGSACVIGVVSVATMYPVPGGLPDPTGPTGRAYLLEALHSLRDRAFRRFLWGLGAATMAAFMMTSFLPLFVKEKVGVAPELVVRLEIAGLAGSALSSVLWGWAADRLGSRPILVPSLALGITVALAWAGFPREVAGRLALVAGLYFMGGAAAAGIMVSTGRLLFNGLVPPERNTAYVALYYAWIGMTGGLAPLLAGRMLNALTHWRYEANWFTLDGYSLLFFTSALLATLAVLLYRGVPPDGPLRTRDVMSRIWQLLLRR